jgi:hypothetical protein
MSNSRLGSPAGFAASALALISAGILMSGAYSAAPDISPLAGKAGSLFVGGSRETNLHATARNFNDIVERPLFSRSRRPFVLPPPEVIAPAPEISEPVQVAAEPQLTLQGVYIQGQVRRALILSTESPAQWQGVGDDISGWNITEIGANGITLEAQGQTRLLKLYVEK